MTNNDIIFQAGQELAEQGKIGYTGRTMTIKTDDGEMVIRETEALHTFKVWKDLGYSVRKGEHAVVKLRIWKHTEKRDEDGEVEDQRMFMKTAAFFSASQVEALA